MGRISHIVIRFVDDGWIQVSKDYNHDCPHFVWVYMSILFMPKDKVSIRAVSTLSCMYTHTMHKWLMNASIFANTPFENT